MSGSRGRERSRRRRALAERYREQTPTKAASERAAPWLVGVIIGVIVGTASVLLPIINQLRGVEGSYWLFAGAGQFGALVDEVGWGVVGIGVALLGMVVAIVAFAGMREVTVGSQHRRELLIDSASYLLMIATGLFTVVGMTILLSVVPAPLLSALADPGSSLSLEMDLRDPATAEALTTQIGQVLIGFTSLGLLAASSHLDATVRAWSRDDADRVATETVFYGNRLRTRKARLAVAARLARRVRMQAAPLWRVRGWAVVWAFAFALVAAWAAAEAVSSIRSAGTGGGTRAGGELVLALSLLALLNVLIVGSAFIGLRSALLVERVRGVAARRWLLAGAIVFTPICTALMFLAGYDDNTWPTVFVLTIVLFSFPTICLCARVGPNSWHEVAVLTASNTLTASIQDDEDRLARLGVNLNGNAAEPGTRAATTEDQSAAAPARESQERATVS